MFFFVQQRGNVSKIEKFRRAFYGYNVHRKQVMHVTALRRSSLKFFATTYYPSNCPFPFQVTFFPFSSERIRMKSLGFLFRFVYLNLLIIRPKRSPSVPLSTSSRNLIRSFPGMWLLFHQCCPAQQQTIAKRPEQMRTLGS